MNEQYLPQQIEETTQQLWEDRNLFQANEEVNKEKFYCLTMFPYPSGRLHMGHVRVYTIGDVISRYQRMLGKNVLQPMGWDAFGLPAENAAIKHKTPPAVWTYQNIDFMRLQMKRLGLGYDWSREVTTCKPSYYHWEQWFFIQLYKKGLVYRKNAEVNWDPVDQTILANEQVVNGRGWRSGALVERREIPQWFFKITDYAEELLNDLDKLDHWPEQVKTMQRNWIGRSEGIEVIFPVKDHPESLSIFTTRPDTLFGVTYVAIAPSHPFAKKAAETNPEIQHFLDEFRNVKVSEAEMATIEKHGIPTGLTAINPATGKEIPIWVANFVLMSYGTGAVMSVPAHDQRDFEFAIKHQLPIKKVIQPENQATWDFTKKAFTDPGILIDSEQFSGLDSITASKQIIDFLEKQGKGSRKIYYRLRDWSISRQRYWGAPIPMIHCQACGVTPVKESDLPVILPENVDFTGVASPLKTMSEFYKTTCPECGKTATRETDTFDTFFESSWYYARFACKNQHSAMLDGRVNYWVPVDQYVGGIEHAVMHLLYARFIHKAMRDEHLLNSDEPFHRLLTQGMVLNQGAKMSKSKGNVVDPEELIGRFGADTVRTFIIFAAPPEQNLEWSDSGVEGSNRFLKRLWAFGYENRELIAEENNKDSETYFDWDNVASTQREVLRQIYEVVQQAKYDYERLQLNTVVSGCMKLLNLLTKLPTAASQQSDISAHILHQGMSMLLRMLAPIAPHITHQLWEDLNYPGSILYAEFPKTQIAALKVDQVELVVQINGKLRSRIKVPSEAEPKLIEQMAIEDSKVQNTIRDKVIKKIITVPGKLINIVTG